MTGNAGSDFRIKLLVVHPDGRRQKFLVTFPERRTLKIDQRYIGLPLTLRVDFVPGAIVCRPGTGHALSIAGKPVKEHSLTVNDVVGLDQYSIEFLELPEPLPMEEATRFVSINDISESTVIVPSIGRDAMDSTPLPVSPALPHRPHAPPAYVAPPAHPVAPQAVAPTQHTPTPNIPVPPPQPDYQPQMYRPDPEDSTAVIRRLQVPGTASAGNNQYSNYANLQATGRTGDTATGVPVPGMSGTAAGTNAGFSPDTSTGIQVQPGFKFGKPQVAIAGIALIALAAYMVVGQSPSLTNSANESSKELASESSEATAPTDTFGDMKPMELSETVADAGPAPVSIDAPTAPIIPAPQSLVPAPVPMTNASGGPIESPFDDKSGFDPMAVDSFFDAVDAGDEAKIKELIDKRLVDINLSRRRGYAALHLAAARGDLATVKYLIKMKADPNVLDGSGATPVMWSVFRRHEAVVKFLAPKTDLKIARQGGETAYDLAKRMKLNRVVKSLDPEPKKSAKKSSSKKRIPTSLPKKNK